LDFENVFLRCILPEILVLGCGRRIQRVSKEVRDFLRSNGIKLEAIDSVLFFFSFPSVRIYSSRVGFKGFWCLQFSLFSVFCCKWVLSLSFIMERFSTFCQSICFSSIWILISRICHQANAASTFNILNEEGRQVAAAMLPQGAT
jgi:hypothetical protein